MASAELEAKRIDRVFDASPRTHAQVEDLFELCAQAEFRPLLKAMGSPTAPYSRHVDTVKLFAASADLRDEVRHAHNAGLAVAIHATEEWEIDAAAKAIALNGCGLRDRLEHGTRLGRQHAELLAAVGASVVANPSWLESRRLKYKAEFGHQFDSLFPLKTVIMAGCDLAFGSDAPVDRPDPTAWIRTVSVRSGPEAIATAVLAGSGGLLWPRATLGATALRPQRNLLREPGLTAGTWDREAAGVKLKRERL